MLSLLRKCIREILTEEEVIRLKGPSLELKKQFDAFMSEYKAMSELNPIGMPGERYWYMGEIEGNHCLVITNLKVWDGAIRLSSIQTVPPGVCEGKGYASDVMNRLVALADKYQVPMSLDPHPFGQKSLGVKELQSWYSRAGFNPRKDRYDEWWRDPS